MTEKKYVYIVKWANEVERYVFLNKTKGYLKVNVADAQIFQSVESAQEFADKMCEDGYETPEIVKVFSTRNAI